VIFVETVKSDGRALFFRPIFRGQADSAPLRHPALERLSELYDELKGVRHGRREADRSSGEKRFPMRGPNA
jgi:hypothetical protein